MAMNIGKTLAQAAKAALPQGAEEAMKLVEQMKKEMEKSQA
jgi:hypothetical protein